MSSNADLEDLEGPRLPGHLYVHVPFCRSKCSYCDFFSMPEADDSIHAAYVRALDSELAQWAYRALPGVIDTVYVGGGTPSILGSALEEVVRSALVRLPVRSDAEVTVEANPDSLSAYMARRLANAGVSRISVGVQSFDDSELRALGRSHDVAQAKAACAWVTQAGVSLSIDLMCGLPGQTMKTWRETVDCGMESGAVHVSVYPLALEPGTALDVAVGTGLVSLPESDEVADMMCAAEEMLEDAGLFRYEVANYAAPGLESAHNMAYWTGRAYIGVGPSAHGMLDSRTAAAIGIASADDDAVSRVRYAEKAELEAWLIGAGPRVEHLTEPERLREDAMLGLRLVRGITQELAEEAGSSGSLDRMRDDGLVRFEDGYWRTTRKGWLLGNEVFRRVWTPDE